MNPLNPPSGNENEGELVLAIIDEVNGIIRFRCSLPPTHRLFGEHGAEIRANELVLDAEVRPKLEAMLKERRDLFKALKLKADQAGLYAVLECEVTFSTPALPIVKRILSGSKWPIIARYDSRLEAHIAGRDWKDE